MRFLILACDYDGTLAVDGTVAESTVAALERLRASGRRLILVTGRQIDDLRGAFDRLDLFDRVVGENGAVVWNPATPDRDVVLSPAPPAALVNALRRRGVPVSVGHAIAATRRPHERTVLKLIRELGLELEIIFNKDAVMVLPTGTTKRSGLTAALRELRLSLHNVVGVGDGENDHAFLGACECGVAVANAVPALKRVADWTTEHPAGQGVEELIERLLVDDLASLEPRLTRHTILLGHDERTGKPAPLRPYGTRLLVSGPSKGGKSSLTLGILERLTAAEYQYCLVDPEGDYEALPGTVTLGTASRAPDVGEVMAVLDRPDQSSVVCLLALPLEERPRYFAQLLTRLEELRTRTERPHWLIIDEAHHVLPAEWGAGDEVEPANFGGLVMIGLAPHRLRLAALRLVNLVCAVGETPDRTLREFCELVGEAPPAAPRTDLERGAAVLWTRGQRRARLIRVEPARADHRRHRRKYVEGELPADRSFYFRGPENRLGLRADNLSRFLELGDGVDDATWLHHLRKGEYSSWIRHQLKDNKLAKRLAEIEHDESLSASESREQVRRTIEERYAPPA